MFKLSKQQEKCESDFYGKHYFEKVGVQNSCLVWRCIRCQKCVSEPIEWI